MYSNVLVTGGSGFVGQALKSYQPNWVFLSSNDCDLTNSLQFYEYLSDTRPQAIVHLAARVGGIRDNANNQAEFLYLNNLINLNVIHQSYRANIRRVLSCLSTCCFPENSDVYPMDEDDLLRGEPTETNYCYAYAKRMLFLQSKYYSKCYRLTYNTFTPANIYGPNNSFDYNDSHFISCMIRKFYEAKPGDTLTFWGSGNPLRQHLYVDDLARIIPLLLNKHNTDQPLVVSPDENLSISEIINIFEKIVNKKVSIEFNNSLDGQYRKDAINSRLLKLIGNFAFTPIQQGLQDTYDWYVKQRLLYDS